ncbi:MAG: hypothetical protein FJX52_01165, partial [Alphaproteobacteria bacterium]|nr:hypothetical protein [Alphaproteobacteria bacterium]
MVATLLAYKGAALAVWLALLFAAERLRPAAPRPSDGVIPATHGWSRLAASGWTRIARNAGLFLVNAGLSPLAVVPISAWASAHG